ncbi:FHA domain-containing protein [Aliikangiella sp. G2MR2-5]|uniref:FHA domain-containing protein n=1 Tax=Aliikangiella sp. G2MR2-5 TaxID=2788943 RepID=UPI0018A916E8|nr:FHA domain-containing protein [Aliikangiella sp. G2MR2-5]
MNNKTEKDTSTGPQGTQVFNVDSVNEMIAAEIAESQSPDATTPALIGVSTNVSGLKYILNKDKMEVGRRPNSDIVLDDTSVSSMHAHIIKSGDNWKVLNLLSSNGTFVNGEKVAEQVITPGDRVAFAGVEFVFAMVDDHMPVAKAANSNLPLIVVGVALAAALGGVLYYLM